jgi:ribose transport system ATP-binding protein
MHVTASPTPRARRATPRSRGIALIHQELSLFPHLTVAENVLMGVEPRRHGSGTRQRAATTREVLAEFGHGDIDPDARLGRLPIGAQQVVEICRAIATRARVVLMDEPTSSLPRGDTERLFALIRRLSATGSRSSTSATSWRRRARSPPRTPSCATAAPSVRGRSERSPTRS